ncbi:MAG: hypothetical protein LBC60_00795, partial [Spirochaetaceae bacterium]|nr:hypothetical protein [Spirochaetaceae bacterium]
ISRDEAERARLESEFKYQLDYQSDMVSSRREGEQIGLEKGERLGAEKERREIAQKINNLALKDEVCCSRKVVALRGLILF